MAATSSTILLKLLLAVATISARRAEVGTTWQQSCRAIQKVYDYKKSGNKAKAISAKLLELNFGEIQWYLVQMHFFFGKYSGIVGKYSGILGKYSGIFGKYTGFRA